MATRRIFLKNSAMAVAGVGTAPLWLRRAALANQGAAKRRKVLVAILQRGDDDGLNMVIPFTEKAYYDYRPASPFPLLRPRIRKRL